MYCLYYITYLFSIQGSGPARWIQWIHPDTEESTEIGTKQQGNFGLLTLISSKHNFYDVGMNSYVFGQ